MKRTLLTITALVLGASPGAWAQSDTQKVERALMAAPAQLRDNATVIDWNDDQTYRTLKEGTNPLVCYDWSGELGEPTFSVQCTSKANLPRVAQNRQFAAESTDRASLQAIHRTAEENGTRIAPEFGSLFISMTGDSPDNARMHTTIAVPGATSASLGLPEDAAQGGAWIMQAGTTYAHIMTPGH